VAVKGWVETMELTALDLARQAVNAGIRTIIYTDIATDGMLQGPNLAAMREMAEAVPCDLIASGGVSGPHDLRALASVPGIHGAIIGRALYEGRMPADLRSILSASGGSGGLKDPDEIGFPIPQEKGMRQLPTAPSWEISRRSGLPSISAIQSTREG